MLKRELNLTKLFKSLLYITAIISALILTACSSNTCFEQRKYILTGPDSLAAAHPYMRDTDGICLFTLEDEFKKEYVLYIRPKYTHVRFEYEFIVIKTQADSTSMGMPVYINYKGTKWENILKKYRQVRVGDAITITLKVNKQYPEYSPDFFQYRDKQTVQEVMGIIYKSSDVINIRGRLFLKR